MIDSLLELESLSISPSYQRRGIGTQLLTAWLALVEKTGAREAGAYLQASKVGKGLYEKFGWKDAGVMEMDFSQWGRETKTRSWNMIRPGSEEGA
jgi:ribosomal protein S18 acetylase RimI-like enzyme